MQAMDLAARTRRIGESATLRVARRAQELKARGVDVVDWGAGEPDFPSPRVAVEAASRALERGWTRYAPVAGIPELRERIATYYRDRYGAPWTAAQVLVTPGAKGALFALAMALFEEGTEVILHTPSWVSFLAQIRLAGAQGVEIPTNGEDGFSVSAEAVVTRIGPATRGVLLNSPCNPTGAVIREGELRSIVREAASRRIWVISDETYERFVYDGQPFPSAAALAREFPETLVVVGSFSKTYAMTGWRVGYLLGPRELVQACAEIQGHTTSHPTSFAMPGALAALEAAEEEVQRMLAEYQARRDLLIARLNALPGLFCRPPAGAFYAFVDVGAWLGQRVPTNDAFAERLLEEEHLALVSGSAFGSDRHVRISFACARAELERGLERLERFLSRLGGA